MSEREFHELLRAIVRRGAPGSRLCARHFAARRPLPPDLPALVQRLAALCAHLDARDASIIYSFEVAEWPAERAGLARWDQFERLEILDPEGDEVPRELDGGAPDRRAAPELGIEGELHVDRHPGRTSTPATLARSRRVPSARQ